MEAYRVREQHANNTGTANAVLFYLNIIMNKEYIIKRLRTEKYSVNQLGKNIRASKNNIYVSGRPSAVYLKIFGYR